MGRSGPPVMPPVLPIETDEETARKHPRARLDARDYWSWIAGAVFGVAAVAAIHRLWYLAYPLALWADLSTFVIAAVLWRWLMPPPPAATFTRGTLTGALIGLLMPPLTWLLFAVYLFVSDPKALGPTFALARATLAPVAAISTLLGALLGAALGAIETASAR